jgi:EpsI family protein
LTRPSVHLIAPERGVIGVDRSAVGIAPSGRVGQQVMVNQLEVRRPQSKLVMYYWYQVGAESIGGEYRFRLTLFRNTVLGKDVPVALVRVSALDGAGSGEAEFLGALLRLVRQAMAGEPP